MKKPFDLQTAMLQHSGCRRFLQPGYRVLAAVSGGVDSMVMLRLLRDAGVDTLVAHCNFGLRGDESDGDEAFVKAEADKMNVPCRVKRFDTSVYAAQNGLSIQMAARELRYRWFDVLSVEENCDAVAVAHNRDDRIETLLINLARGTGIRGLSGVKPQNGNIVRPPLFSSRKTIEDYAREHNVPFREDSSNATDKYARNYIRHHVIPGLERYFPGIRQALDRSIEHFSAVESFYSEAVERYKSRTVSTQNEIICIDLQKLAQSPSPAALLYEILKPFGFSGSAASKILEEHGRTSGRQFFGNGYRAVCDRQMLILQKRNSELPRCYLIDEQTSQVTVPVRLKLEKFAGTPGFKPDADPCTACMDGDKLQFPLLLRRWEHGDIFRPLGMKNMKRLSDFFINAKLSIVEKEAVWLLVSGGQIAWIAGLRIDDRFKITGKTTRVVRIVMEK